MKTRESVLRILFLFALWSGVTPNPVAAQSADLPVAVAPFAGENPALSEQVRNTAIIEIDNLEGFTPRPLDSILPGTDEAPDPAFLSGEPYAVTGEYYFDSEDRQHFQMWLWNSADGSLVYTDELVADDVEEAEGYLPSLVAWVFSKIEREEPAPAPEEPAPVLVEPAPVAVAPPPEPEIKIEGADPESESEEEAFARRFYLGFRGAAALDFHSVRSSGNYEGGMSQSFSGEGALTVEFRPWARFGFQTEGIFALDAVAPFKVGAGSGQNLHTTDRYTTMSLLFPLFLKAPFNLGTFELSLLGGAYYILPLKFMMDGDSYTGKLNLPLGIMAGFELGNYSLGAGGRFGELYGGLRYGLDLGATMVDDTGLQYTRSRLALSLGYRYLFLGRP